jgi:NaMN:DMB phosphoribosyltransferase
MITVMFISNTTAALAMTAAIARRLRAEKKA